MEKNKVSLKEITKTKVKEQKELFAQELLDCIGDANLLLETIYKKITDINLGTDIFQSLIRQKALFIAIYESNALHEFLLSFEKPQFKAELFFSEKTYPTAITQTLWLHTLLKNMHLISRINKFIPLEKDQVLQKKSLVYIKATLTKNLNYAHFPNYFKTLPIGGDDPATFILIRTLFYMLFKEPSLLSVSMDTSTIIPHALVRIPFVLVNSKLRNKILHIYELNPVMSLPMFSNVLTLIGYIVQSDNEAYKKSVETTMINLLYLIHKMAVKQIGLFLDQIKLILPTLMDENIALILVRLMKIPFGEEELKIIMAILGNCVAQAKFSFLIDLMQNNQIIKTLVSYLKFPDTQKHALILLKFFLVGFQISPTFFHGAIPEFQKVSIYLLGKKTTLNKDQIRDYIILLLVLMRLFPGYPVQYTPMLELIKQYKSVFSIEAPSEEQIEEMMKSYSWLAISQKIGGTSFAGYNYNPQTIQKTSEYKGLANLGNTCYMNCVLQALYFSQIFRQELFCIDPRVFMEKMPPAPQTEKTGKIIQCFQSSLIQLQKLFALMTKSTRPYITPSVFRNTLPDYFKKSFFQQDASEFFKVLSDILEKDAKIMTMTPSENVFSKNFENHLNSKIECQDCHSVMIKPESFVDLFIPIEETGKDLVIVSTSDLLFPRLFKEDIFEKENAYFCGKCNKNASKAIRTCSVDTLSSTLILTVNRFYYDTTLKKRIKKMNPISFPFSLIFPQQVLGAEEASKYNPSKFEYDLYAIIIHSGTSSEAGHYYTIAKDLASKKWVILNDIYTNVITEADIGSFLQNNPIDTPYMLFYQRQGEKLNIPAELNILPEHLNKFIESDNTLFLKEIENRNKKVDYNKILNELIKNQMNDRSYDPEPKPDNGFGGNPDVF